MPLDPPNDTLEPMKHKKNSKNPTPEERRAEYLRAAIREIAMAEGISIEVLMALMLDGSPEAVSAARDRQAADLPGTVTIASEKWDDGRCYQGVLIYNDPEGLVCLVTIREYRPPVPLGVPSPNITSTWLEPDELAPIARILSEGQCPEGKNDGEHS